MKKLITDLFTGPDNKTWDFVRIFIGFATSYGLAASTVSVIKTGAFDFQNFGVGVGALVGAGAVGMWARKDVELSPEHYAETAKEDHAKC
jgi:hypothetical protein